MPVPHPGRGYAVGKVRISPAASHLQQLDATITSHTCLLACWVRAAGPCEVAPAHALLRCATCPPARRKLELGSARWAPTTCCPSPPRPQVPWPHASRRRWTRGRCGGTSACQTSPSSRRPANMRRNALIGVPSLRRSRGAIEARLPPCQHIGAPWSCADAWFLRAWL